MPRHIYDDYSKLHWECQKENCVPYFPLRLSMTTLVGKPDALLAIAVETSSVTPIVDACYEAGVSLIFVNRNPFRGR